MCITANIDTTKVLLKHERSEREKLMETFCVLNHKVNHMIDAWNGNGNYNIKKSQLREFPLRCWVELSEGVEIMKLDDLPGDIIVFDTKMEKGRKFGLHMHSDCDETCDVLEGKIVDILTNETYNAGNRALWPKGVEHIPVALKETRLMVYFK